MQQARAQVAGGTPAPRPRLRLLRDDAWLAIAGPALIFAGHALYGAMLPQTALVLTAIAALLVGGLMLRPRLRRDLMRLDGLALPAALFGVVILVSLWSLTPYVPGGPHPVWAYLKISPGASTIDKSATLLETIKLLGLACFFVIGLATGPLDARARLAVNLLIGLAAALGVWAFLTFVSGGQTDGGGRLEASFQSANTAGTIFAASFVLVMGPLARRATGAPRQRLTGAAIFGAAALLFLACVFATASRGAFMALFVGLGAFLLLFILGGRMKLSRGVLIGVAAALVLGGLMAVSGTFLLHRLVAATPEFNARSFVFKVHWQAFLDSPLLGYGLGTFDEVNRMLLNAATFPRLWDVRAAHNVYLGWLEEGGLLAATPMFACIIALVVTTVRKGLRRTRMIPVLFALVGVDLVYAAHGAVDFALQMFSVSAMWAYVLGLQFGLAQGSSNR